MHTNKKIEESLTEGNSRYAWQGVKNMTNIPDFTCPNIPKSRCKPSPKLHGYEGLDMANQLNSYYCHFENRVSDAISVFPVPSDSNLLAGFHINETIRSDIFLVNVTPVKAQVLIEYVDMS